MITDKKLMQYVNEINTDLLPFSEANLFNNYKIYETIDTSIIIPKEKCGVLLISDNASIGIESLLKSNIGNQIDYMFVPNTVKVYDKVFEFNDKIYNPDILAKYGIQITNNLTTIDKSFIIDMTPYIAFLYNRFNIYKYPLEAIKFINLTINSAIKTIENKNAITKWIVIHIIDDHYLNSTKILNDMKLYAYMYLNPLLNSNGEKLFGENLDNVFIYSISGNTHKIFKIYDKDEPINSQKLIEAFGKVLPNIKIEDNSNEDNDVKGEVVNNRKVKEIESKTPSIKPPDNSPLMKKAVSDFKELLNLAKKEYTDKELFSANSKSEKSPLDIKPQVQQSLSPENAIIEKIDQDKYNENRNIPLLDSSQFSLVNEDSNTMFPYLNATKVENDNITDVNHVDIKDDKSSDLNELLSNLVPQLTETKEQEKKMFDYLFNKFTRDPTLLAKVKDAYDKNDMHQLLVYINHDRLPYHSNIYPEKGEVDRTVLNELDNWSKDNGYDVANSSDKILNSDLLQSVVHTNIHRVMAQKTLTWNKMPQEIERYISKLLDNNGFQLIDVSIVDKDPPITQIEPTYISEIRIRIRNKKTRTQQTLIFNVQTLKEGKYHVSGGINWLFPNVIATLPIFVRKPGYKK